MEAIEQGRTVNRRGWLRPIGGAMLIAAGLWVMLYGPRSFFAEHGFRYEQLEQTLPSESGFPELGGRFPAEKLTRYRLGEKGGGVELSVAAFKDRQGAPASAIVYPAAAKGQEALPSKGDARLRHDLWQGVAQAIVAHTGEDALVLSWWDDAQRVRFLSGRTGWAGAPVAAAYPDPGQRRFWQLAGGGFDRDDGKLRQLARWLAMDADTALAEMAAVLPKDRAVYFLACVDDLARLSEIEALSGVSLPFEVRVFSPSDNIHSQISEVKRWAGEKGTGSYLVQQLSSGGVRAWRLTSDDGANTLLARLLPFTGSVGKAPGNLSLVYQSGWGGYLTIYQWKP